MVYAQSIHIDSENIYPLWNGCGHNGPVFFKEIQSETAISSEITPENLNLLHERKKMTGPCLGSDDPLSFHFSTIFTHPVSQPVSPCIVFKCRY